MTSTLDRLTAKTDQLVHLRQTHVQQWVNDPVKWVEDCITFDEGQGLTDYQKEELAALPEHHRVAVRGPRGSGKTMPAALVFWWFATTRELLGVDWKIPTTAGSWDQIRLYLWPEIHKWYKRIRWDVLQMPQPVLGRDLLTYHLKLGNGEGFGRATDDPALIEGAHASHMLVIIDEGKAVADGIWDAVEGFFANPGEHYAYALSTPGAPAGRFSDIHHRKPGYEDWHPIHVTKDQAVNAGRVTQEWVDQRVKQWGVDSQLYRSHVLAEFAGEEDGVIPLAWVEAAIERGRNLDRKVRPERFGVDVADTGDDQSVIAWRDHWDCYKLEIFPPAEADVLLLAERVINRAVKGSTVVVDSIGVGAGTYRALARAKDINAVSFVAGAKTNRRDSSGEMKFANKRSGAWWNLRELLHPESGEPVSLPDDPQLLGDLTAPRWREVAGGKIQIEAKIDIKKRLGRSTDVGDAVVMVFWEEKRHKGMAGADLTSDLGKPSLGF